MASMPHPITRTLLGFLLSTVLGVPLHAQLDPRLQGSKTDFLDLYQQANLNVKPEIVSVFDFSGSMQSLMYHRCYYNTYIEGVGDNGDTTGINFHLSGVPGSFKVTATVGPTGTSKSPGWGYSSQILIRPDGSQVTEAGVDSTPTGTGLYGDKSVTGAGSQACDVRNWVRAASHIRLTKGGRTIDLPIPWKVMDANSTGYPLSSMMVQDVYNGQDDQGNPVTYGSGQWIEVDTRYKIQTFPAGTDLTTQTNNIILTGPANQAITDTKYMLRLNQAYLDWLFTGTYQATDNTRPDYDPSQAGHYIVYDAASLTPNGIPVGYQTRVNQGQGFGTFLSGEDAQKARVLPARDRVQAVKEAVIRTWIQYQTRVLWAFRFLDDMGEAGNDGHGHATSTTINNDSTKTVNSTDPTTVWVNGKDTGWTLFNGNSVPAMRRLAALFPYTNTPLCYAMSRSLAQFADPNNVFGTVETGSDAPVKCQMHFLILFTDGVPSVDYDSENQTASPYLNASGVGNAQSGNAALIGAPTNLNPGSSWWNIFTFAGAAAHLADTSKSAYTADQPITTTMAIPSYPSSGSPSSYLPFAIPKRKTLTLAAPYTQVTTMTIGVSLGGNVGQPKSPKYRLFSAAAVGDPRRTSWNLQNLTAYTPIDASRPELGKTKNSVYYFDATDPQSLISNLGYAFTEATSMGMVGTTSNTNLPFIGASIGNQIYIGRFQPPVGGDVLWSGDLLMFPTMTGANKKTLILDKTGSPTNSLTVDNAMWAASSIMPLWSNRKLFTRIPGATALSSFTYTGTAYSDSTSGLQNFVATDNPTGYPAGSTSQQQLIQTMMGAELSDTTKNRLNIMGDIIDSSPAYLEYDTGSLPSPYANLPAGSHFRIILVGTNQGWLHAFGETTSSSSVDDPTSTSSPKTKISLVSGTAQELWAFMPTDFLANLDYLDVHNHSHKFMVDGSPSIYFLDLPPSGGGTGNGKLDGANITINPATDTTHERAIAIIGMRKGGRSYYALNLHDPTAPTLQWSLVPDEASQIPSDRNETGLDLSVLQGIVANMGYSTCAPSFGRVLFKNIYRDVVFFGGGLSLPEIEAKFTGSPLMGRSVLALDVNNGHFLAAVDMAAVAGGYSPKTMVGPIPAGVVPFEYFLGSGMAQRAYFLDMWGGLWCWGSRNIVPETPFSSYSNMRRDTSELTAWSDDGTTKTPYGTKGIRKVYQDQNSVVTASASTPTTYSFLGPKYTTPPSPFLVGTFPGAGVSYTDGTAAVPTAVGIAMESGDRNNPADYGSNNPANTRLTMVFDRQDSRAWGLDSSSGQDTGINKSTQLLNAGKWGANGGATSTYAYGDNAISPGNTSYYLAPTPASSTQFGYYVTFPDASLNHYSKGINPPVVVANSLYYAYFTPVDVDVCSGVTGYTYSNRICDALNPVVSDVRTGVNCVSGWVDTWFNVASDFTMLAASGVQQAGTRSGTSGGVATVTSDTNTYLGPSRTFFPKARVWRTVR